MARPPAGAKRIVIYRLGSLGDTVVALPCFHQIARLWPAAERVVLTNFPVASNAAPLEIILRESGLIHWALQYPVGTRSLRELWRLAARLRSLDAEVLIYLTAPRGRLTALRDWLFFKMCGFGRIVGAPLSDDLQHCREITGPEPESFKMMEPESSRLARCLRELGPIDLSDPALWDLHLTAHELQAGKAISVPLASSGYFAINMGGKAKEKDWGIDNWGTLLAALTRRHPGVGLLIVGAPEDSERAALISSRWRGPVVDACGKLNPRESAAAMRGAIGFLGHDSGPLHLAATVGLRCVGLFGNYNVPKRWHPHGDQHRIIHHMQGIASITVDEVLNAVDEIAPSPSGSARPAAPSLYSSIATGRLPAAQPTLTVPR